MSRCSKWRRALPVGQESCWGGRWFTSPPQHSIHLTQWLPVNRPHFIPAVWCWAPPGTPGSTFPGLEDHYVLRETWSWWVEAGLIPPRNKRRHRQGIPGKKGTQDKTWRNFLRVLNYIQTLLLPFLVSYSFLTASNSFSELIFQEKEEVYVFVLGDRRSCIICPLSCRSYGTESLREKLVSSSSGEERVKGRKQRPWRERDKGECTC